MTWPTCPSTVELLLHSGIARCVLPEHHQMDGEAWHTDGTSLRWRREDEPPPGYIEYIHEPISLIGVSHRYPADSEAVA